MENEVVFDDKLQDYADKEGIFKSSDLKYYILTFAFIGLGFIVIKKFGKK